jgi:hypothetical protein
MGGQAQPLGNLRPARARASHRARRHLGAAGPWQGCLDAITYVMLMVIAADVVEFPATSVATAVSLCVPFAILFVFQENEYGLLVTVARTVVPSR